MVALATTSPVGRMSGRCRSFVSNYAEFRFGEPANTQQNRVRVQRKGSRVRPTSRECSDAVPGPVWPTVTAATAVAPAAATSAAAAGDFFS